MACVSCKIIANKYKCIKCLQPYCSVPCYNEHKQSPCQDLRAIAHTAQENLESETGQAVFEPFTTEDTVSRKKLEQLRHSAGVRNLLYNPELRKLLHEVDIAPNARVAVCAAMQEPLFIEFANECLKIVESADEEEEEEKRM